ncbi:PD40 domain-containing protein [Rhodanobacter sp. DHG33]|nr:PD40 domain-containing protein [Rhodanobacter sp. DHG33]
MLCRHLVVIVALALGVVVCAPPARAAANDTATPPAEGPWMAAHDASPAFAPDGDTVVFTRGSGTARRLYIAQRHDGAWSAPVRAPFSNQWMDFEPTMAPDGSYLVFVSNRPANGTGKALDGNWGGKAYPARGGNLWRVDRAGDGWGTPQRLSEVVNAGTSIFSPTVAADGSLTFVRVDPANGTFRLYRSRQIHGRYQAAQALALGGGDANSDYDPTVAADGSFLVFSSDRPPAPSNGGDLFIAFATHNGWNTPTDLGVVGDEARLGPDHTTLYFSAADHRIHRLMLAPWLAQRATAKP